MLEKVREAIYDIVNKGASLRLNGRLYTRHNIRELHDLEKSYQNRVDSGGGTNFIRVKPL